VDKGKEKEERRSEIVNARTCVSFLFFCLKREQKEKFQPFHQLK
jgi:hypothetical protein